MEDDSESGPGSVVVGWSEEKSSPVAGAGRFEFVLMGADGGLDKAGISQIRAHTTRELHKMRRKTGQVLGCTRDQTRQLSNLVGATGRVPSKAQSAGQYLLRVSFRCVPDTATASCRSTEAWHSGRD